MKFLVINMMHIGDALLITPVLRVLRNNFPDAAIDVLTATHLVPIFDCNPCVRCIKALSKHPSPAEFVALLRSIRADHYDHVINLHRNELASAVAAFSNSPHIVGYSKPGFSLFFHEVYPNLKAVMHQVHSHFAVLRHALNLSDFTHRGLEMEIPPEAEEEMRREYDKVFGGAKVVALNIGASWLTKRWCASYFANCADLLLERGFGIAFLGAEFDRPIVDDCVKKMSRSDSERLKIFTGDFSLHQLAGFLDNCSLLLTTDSGPMHVGVARNIPIVTMFGASPVPGFYPYDSKDILIKTPEPCHPCGKHICPKRGDDNLACMKHTPVSVVMKYVFELLDTYGQPAKDIPRVPGAYKCRVIDLARGCW